MTPIQNRHDFVFFFDIKNGNPNGDPDNGNMPRMDNDTQKGLVTDVALKRKIRNYVDLKHGGEPPYAIYMREKAVLNTTHSEAYTALGIKSDAKKLPREEEGRKITRWMCDNFYDIRTFGAVLSLKTAPNCGQVRGPVQITFARSIDPIVTLEHSITRCAVATEAEAEKQGGDNRTMGRKFTVPYGLYRAHGFISAHLAGQTKFDESDLNVFWEALKNMFEHDHSAARGEMATRGLYVFKHEGSLGNAPAHKLFDLIKPELKDKTKPPRDFTDYQVTTPPEGPLPGFPGVEINILCT